ncbi:hypothetical protein BV898_02952 [Hypsibius exemplaris]|uniref:DUF3504 domain-containing protein n=1 Tax=Hypsibius exemplaris TaxID=2072580 RepID=A0A1W0X6P9_HYPEX|nr:hypothetical protein BV898_02952 [Hypsibius exemplaris]
MMQLNQVPVKYYSIGGPRVDFGNSNNTSPSASFNGRSIKSTEAPTTRPTTSSLRPTPVVQATSHPSATTGGPSPQSDMDDDTNPLFISAVRIFLDFVRDKHAVACPEKTCSLDELIRYLGDFQDEARTKKGERYSPSTIRVIRYSLNRVIALGRNQQEMRPYPTQSTGVRKNKRGKLEQQQQQDLKGDGEHDGGGGARRTPPGMQHHQQQHQPLGIIVVGRDRCDSFASTSGDQFAPQLKPYGLMKSVGHQPTDLRSIQNGIEPFRNWLTDQGINSSFESFSDEHIDDQLVNFVRFGKTRSGKEFSRSAMQTFRVAITQYLKQQNGVNIDTDLVFEPTREAFRRALAQSPIHSPEKKLFPENCSSGLAGTEWLGIPVECIKDLYRCGALSTTTATTLQRKVWLELTIFFRGVPCCPDQIFWNKNTFKISSGDHGVKYIELNPDVYNRYGCNIERLSEQAGRIMVQRTGSPYCPVASFETYLQALNSSNDSLFVQPRHSLEMQTEFYRSGMVRDAVRYSSEPLSGVHLGRIMEDLAQAAKLPFHFTALSAAETDHVAWMRALTALELELQCQALQFAFPTITSNNSPRSTASSSPESVGLYRTSVIQSAPRAVVRALTVPSSPQMSSSDTDSSLIYGRSRSSTSEIKRTQDNMSPEAIDLVWRKKMKLDHCYSPEALRARSHTIASMESQSSAISIDFHPAIQGNSAIVQSPSDHDENSDHSSKSMSPVTPKEEPYDTRPAGGENDLSVEEFKQLYTSGVFDPDTPETLQDKVMFEVNLNFGRIAPFPKKLKLWNKNFFQALIAADGRKVVKVGSASREGDDTPTIYETKGSRHCSVASYEKYMSLLSKSSKLLWAKALPKGEGDWYSPEVSDTADIDTCFAKITKKAGLSKTITQQSLNEVTIKNWSDALEQLRGGGNEASTSAPNSRSGSIGEKPTGDGNSRPTVKRILDYYRKSKESGSEKNEEQPVTATHYSTPEPRQRSTAPLDVAPEVTKVLKTTPTKEPKRPVILVRPQIVIVNNGDAAHLERSVLKQMISDALAKAVGSADWESQMEEAITAAQGGELLKKIHSAPEVYSHHKGSSTSLANLHYNNEADDENDDTASMSSYGSGKMRGGLRIADMNEEPEAASETSSSVTDKAMLEDETHGSHRRKAFLPVKHSE